MTFCAYAYGGIPSLTVVESGPAALEVGIAALGLLVILIGILLLAPASGRRRPGARRTLFARRRLSYEDRLRRGLQKGLTRARERLQPVGDGERVDLGPLAAARTRRPAMAPAPIRVTPAPS